MILTPSLPQLPKAAEWANDGHFQYAPLGRLDPTVDIKPINDALKAYETIRKQYEQLVEYSEKHPVSQEEIVKSYELAAKAFASVASTLDKWKVEHPSQGRVAAVAGLTRTLVSGQQTLSDARYLLSRSAQELARLTTKADINLAPDAPGADAPGANALPGAAVPGPSQAATRSESDLPAQVAGPALGSLREAAQSSPDLSAPRATPMTASQVRAELDETFAVFFAKEKLRKEQQQLPQPVPRVRSAEAFAQNRERRAAQITEAMNALHGVENTGVSPASSTESLPGQPNRHPHSPRPPVGSTSQLAAERGHAQHREGVVHPPSDAPESSRGVGRGRQQDKTRGQNVLAPGRGRGF